MTGHWGEASEQIYSHRPVSCLFFPCDSDYKSWVEGLLEWLIMIPHPSRGERSENWRVHYLWKRQTAVNQDLLMLCFLEKCSFEMEIQRTVRQLNRDKSKDVWDISGESSTTCYGWRGAEDLAAPTCGEACQLRLLARSWMHRAEMLSGAGEDVWGAGVGGAFSVLM